ncbi:MAG: DUF4139 domain-containing protein [Bacteroidia bacterium]
MKKLLLPLLFLSLQIQAKEVELKTSLTDVTVFRTGAQVKRSGSVMIPAGEQEIRISDATSLLNKESIQVKGEGDFTILSVNPQVACHDVNNEKASWTKLEAEKKSLMQRMEEGSIRIQVLNAEETVLTNLKNTGTSAKSLNPDQISKAQEVVKSRLAAVKMEKLKLTRDILSMFETYQNLSQHLLALKTPRQYAAYEIILKVSAKTAVKGNFTLTYLVPEAHWTPTYDLRIASVSEPLVIEYKANVSQESGEDWNNVHLVFSTGDPSLSAEKPKPEPWLLYLNRNSAIPESRSAAFNENDKHITRVKGVVIDNATGSPIPWGLVMVDGTTVGVMADSNGVFSLALPEKATMLTASAVGYSVQSLSLTEPNIVVSMQKNEPALREYVKTDYEGQLFSLHADVEPLIALTLTPGSYSFGDVAATGTGATQKYYYENGASISYSADKSVSAILYKMPGVSASPTAVKSLNIVNTEFKIEEKYTIPSDAKNIAVLLQRTQTEAHYQYYCTPRLDKDVFLTAQLVNWEQYNFLEGQANVFLEGTFTGSTQIDTHYLVDTLEISLGRDKGIKVERKKSLDFNKHNAIGSENTALRNWDITVRNAKAKPVDIIIQDQFPVSSDSRITVTQEERSNGKLDEKSGIITWQLKLEPSASKVLALKYKVKYPKGNFIGLD